MVLCRLFARAKIDFAVAHCNFQLRGNASDEDEILVRMTAKALDLPYFVTSFDTATYATQHKLSIQVAARELRYEWLEKIRVENGYQYIATAHHLNDSIETVLYNFAKGTGIRGMHGILPKNGHIIRPLLFATKEDILAYAKTFQVNYREDESNHSDKYQRNFIRHHLVPIFKNINTNFESNAAESIQHLRDTELIFNFAIANIKDSLVLQQGDQKIIAITQLQSYPAPTTVLYEIMKEYGFHSDTVSQLMQALDGQSGKQFFSATHQALIDRGHILIKAIAEIDKNKVYISEGQTTVDLGQQQLFFEKMDSKPTTFTNDNKMTYLDADKLVYPLTLRRWEAGDSFQPLGLGGRNKKLKDFFNDIKLSRFEKDLVWLLESDGKICWVLGQRLDERFKLRRATENVICVKIVT